MNRVFKQPKKNGRIDFDELVDQMKRVCYNKDHHQTLRPVN